MRSFSHISPSSHFEEEKISRQDQSLIDTAQDFTVGKNSTLRL